MEVPNKNCFAWKVVQALFIGFFVQTKIERAGYPSGLLTLPDLGLN